MIRIQPGLTERLLAHAQRDVNQECCGLLAGRDDVITRTHPATNSASDAAMSYEIAPQELFRLMREIRGAGLLLLGIYHSHPGGENRPSPRDIERAYYPAAAYFIISPRADAAHPVRAFSIQDGRAFELEIQII